MLRAIPTQRMRKGMYTLWCRGPVTPKAQWQLFQYQTTNAQFCPYEFQAMKHARRNGFKTHRLMFLRNPLFTLIGHHGWQADWVGVGKDGWVEGRIQESYSRGKSKLRQANRSWTHCSILSEHLFLCLNQKRTCLLVTQISSLVNICSSAWIKKGHACWLHKFHWFNFLRY